MEAKNCEANRYKRNSSEGMADSDVNDITLYQRFLSGDDSGLQRLMERYGNSLTLYIDGYLHDIHEAEDLMIEAFAYFVAKRPRLRDDGFRAYLYKSARHLALRCLQKKRRKQLFSFDDLEQEPAHPASSF